MSDSNFKALESTSGSATPLSSWDNSGSVGEKIPANVPTNPDGSAMVQALTDAELRATPVDVSVSGLPLPTGAATSVKQDTGNASLASIDSKLTSPLSVSASALPLPTGAATSALQTTGNTSLSSIDTKTPALVTGRVPVDGSGVTQPVSASSLPLPTGAATSSNQTSGAQKSQIVDGSGNVVGSTSNALDVNIKSGVTIDVQLSQANDSVQVYGNDGTTNRAIKTDSTGVVQVATSALPLPTGASTSALQTTGNTSLGSIDSKTPALGQATSSSSVPVVLPVSQIAALTPLTTVDVTQATGSNLHTVVDSGSISVSNFPATQPVSGTVTANAGTGTMLVDGSAHTQPISGSVSVSSVSGSISISNFPATQPVSAASLPLPTGAATSAKQPALGTAGTPSTDVLTVQGEASMTPLLVDGSAVTQPVSGSVSVSNFPATQPVSGTVAATQSGTWTVQPGNTPNTVAWKVDGSAVTQPVSGTVTANAGTGTMAVSAASLPLPTGAATAANQATEIASLSSIDSKLTSPLTVTGPLTDTQLRATPVPISGTVTANAGTGAFFIRSTPVATYAAAVTGLSAANTATDIFTITGSATKTIRVKHISMDGTQNTAGTVNILLIKRSTANTAGTSTARTAVSFDSTNPAATATVLSYTANPTVGTLVGTIHNEKMFVPTTATNTPDELKFDYTVIDNMQEITLRGTNEVLAINLNGVTIAANNFNIDITWTEE